MPTRLDDPMRPKDRFLRSPRSSVAEAVRRALRPRGTRGKTPFELGSRAR